METNVLTVAHSEPSEGKCKLIGCSRAFGTIGVPYGWWSQRIVQS